MKPLALDLCCGKGGWTRGLLNIGWDVIGLDIEDMGGYPTEAKLILGDVRHIGIWNETDYRGPQTVIGGHVENRRVDLIVASPPCQEFSKRSLPFKVFKNLPPPPLDIWEGCLRFARILGCPIVIENVRGAQKWVGKADAHLGPFYLWGNLPALLPDIKPKKGFVSVKGRGMGGEYERPGFRELVARVGHKEARKQRAAEVAVIPLEIAEWVAKSFYPVAVK